MGTQARNIAQILNTDSTITTADIADDAVTGAKIENNPTIAGNLTVSGNFTSQGINDDADAVAMTIDSGENVAIGVTSKNSANNGSLTIGHTGMTKITGTANGNADELVLIGADASANVGMSIISNNANIGGIFFGDEDDTDIGRIEYNHSDNSMRLYSNTAEQLRLHSNGVLSASDGIALGVGLNNTASNVLDDYEEGTWTPDIRNADNANTFGTEDGYYTKVGNRVFVQFRSDYGNTGGGGGIQIRNLPFTINNNFSCVGIVAVNGGSMSGNNKQYAVFASSGTTMQIYNGGAISSETYSFLSGSLHYITNS